MRNGAVMISDMESAQPPTDHPRPIDSRATSTYYADKSDFATPLQALQGD
jgi:hypothetical protein